MNAQQIIRHVCGPHRLRTHTFGPWTEPRFKASRFRRNKNHGIGFGVTVTITFSRHTRISGSDASVPGWYFGWSKFSLYAHITTHRYERYWSAYATDLWRSEAEPWVTYKPKLEARIAARKVGKRVTRAVAA